MMVGPPGTGKTLLAKAVANVERRSSTCLPPASRQSTTASQRRWFGFCLRWLVSTLSLTFVCYCTTLPTVTLVCNYKPCNGLLVKFIKHNQNYYLKLDVSTSIRGLHRRSWYSVLPVLDTTGRRHVKKAVVCVVQLVAALITSDRGRNMKF